MSRRHQAEPQQFHHLENLQDDEAQRLRGGSKVTVRMWTFRGAEKESESERREESPVHHGMFPQQPEPVAAELRTRSGVVNQRLFGPSIAALLRAMWSKYADLIPSYYTLTASE